MFGNNFVVDREKDSQVIFHKADIAHYNNII